MAESIEYNQFAVQEITPRSGRETSYEIIGETRVMSPKQPNNNILMGITCSCQVCQIGVSEPVVCTSCGISGHVVCIGAKPFQNYMFCERCMPQAIAQWSAYEDMRKRQEWDISFRNQLASWKSKAVEALGVSTTVGIAIGGAAATAVGAAVAATHGIVQGISQASTPLPALADQVPIPSSPPNTDSGTVIQRPLSLQGQAPMYSEQDRVTHSY